MMRRLSKTIILYLIGGGIYSAIEVIFKALAPSGGNTHWSMFAVGGLMFLSVGAINELLPWEMPLFWQGIIGSVIITAVELVTGLYLNIYLGLNIWDYSDECLNLFGQICLRFSLFWVLLAVVAVVLDDWLRYWVFKEERPHYMIF